MAAKKKVAKKRTAKKKTTAKKKPTSAGNWGRPSGSPNYTPKGLEVRSTTPLARSNSKEKVKGLKRVILETVDPDQALRLQKLASLVKKKDKKLMSLIS